MYAPVPVAGSELLKQVHITELEIIMRIRMKTQPDKKAVLVIIIIHDLLPGIDMNLIIHHDRKCTRGKSFLT